METETTTKNDGNDDDFEDDAGVHLSKKNTARVRRYTEKGEERFAAMFERERGGGQNGNRKRQVRRSVEETRRKNDEPEIISGVAERSRPNADVPSLYEKLMTSRFSRRSPPPPSSPPPPTLFFSLHFPSAKFIPSSLLLSPSFFLPFLLLLFLLFSPSPPPFYLTPVSLYCQPPLLTISRVSTKFSRATIPDRLYNYPVLSSSGRGGLWGNNSRPRKRYNRPFKPFTPKNVFRSSPARLDRRVHVLALPAFDLCVCACVFGNMFDYG